MSLRDILELGTYGFNPDSEVTIFQMEDLEETLEENPFSNIYIPNKEDAIIPPYDLVIAGDTLVAITQ